MAVTLGSAFFLIPMSDAEKDALTAKVGTDGDAVTAAMADPEIAYITAGTQLMVAHSYREMVNRHTPFRRWIKMSGFEEAMANATPAFKARIDAGVKAARDDVRGTFTDPAYTEPPMPDLDANASGRQAAAQMLAAHDGFVVGRAHSDEGSVNATADILADPNSTVNLLFVEELRVETQAELDAWLAAPPDAAMGPALKERLAELKTYMYTDWEPLLYQAKQKGVRVVGIDSSEAEPGVPSSDPLYGERRATVMNKLAKDVIERETAATANPKFVVLTGEMHLNCDVGGVPGLSQLLGVPGVRENGAGKFRVFPDDPSKRGMVTELQQAFLDAAITKAKADYDAIPADQRPRSNLDMRDMRRVLEPIARQFTADGSLNVVGDIPGLVARGPVQAAITALCETTKGRRKRIDDLVAVVDAGNLGEVTRLVDEDPFIVNSTMAGDSYDETLLHIAAQKGKTDIADFLLDRDANPNLLSKKGETPLHLAMANDTLGGADAARLATKMMAKGARSDLPGPDTRTGYKIAMQRGDSDALAVLVDAGQGSVEDLFVKEFEIAARAAYEVGRDPAQHENLNADELAALARARYQAEIAGTAPPTDAAAVKAMFTGNATITGEIDALRTRTRARKANKTALAAAIGGNDAAESTRVLALDPMLKTIPVSEGCTAVGLAAKGGHNKALRALVAGGADVNAKSERGRTPLHELFSREVRKTDLTRQAEVTHTAGVLLRRHADPDIPNGRGQTALHLAGFRNNVSAVNALIDAGADATKRDDRGWSAYEMTLGATNKEAEAAFQAKGAATTASPIAGPGPYSTVDILCRATLCADPGKDALAMRKMYEDMYAVDTMRPMLDLAAAAACNDRNPPKGGLRVFAQNSNTVGQLYGAGVGPSGAYDEKVNSLLVGTQSGPGSTGAHKTNGGAIGTVAHEMTHLAVHLVTDDEATIPFTDNAERDAYLEAIEKDMATLHRLSDSDPAQAYVRERFSGRMQTYAQKKTDPATGVPEPDFTNARERLLQEHIVSIPQLMVTYGEDFVRKHLPNMCDFVDDFGAKARDTLANDPRFAAGAAKIDAAANQAMVHRLQAEQRGPRPNAVVLIDQDAPEFKIDNIMQRLEGEFIARHGRRKASTLADGPGVASSAADFEVDPNDQAALDRRMRKLRAALERTLAASELPPRLLPDALGAMLEKMGDALDLTMSDKDAVEAASRISDTWVKSSMIDYVEFRIADRRDITPAEMARAAVYKSELIAHAGGATGEDWQDHVIDVNKSREKRAIDALTTELAKPANAALLRHDGGRATQLLRTLPRNVTRGPADTAIRVKTTARRFGTRDPDHVSINVKQAKRDWVDALASVNAWV